MVDKETAKDSAVKLKDALKALHSNFPPLPPMPMGNVMRSAREKMILDLLEQYLQKALDGSKTNGSTK